MAPVDLTLPVSPAMPVFPGSPRPAFIPWERLSRDGYNLELLFMSSHTGTHMDAPLHFVDGAASIDRVRPSQLVTDAVLVRTRSHTITKKDIVRFEKRNGALRGGITVVFQTGWSNDLTRPDYFTANPGLRADAARYMIARGVRMVGIDSPSIDLGSAQFPVHHILAEAGALIVENLANLARIKSNKFKLAVFPLKLRGATGSPVRALAL